MSIASAAVFSFDYPAVSGNGRKVDRGNFQTLSILTVPHMLLPFCNACGLRGVEPHNISVIEKSIKETQRVSDWPTRRHLYKSQGTCGDVTFV
jgi:hypothetical protein